MQNLILKQENRKLILDSKLIIKWKEKEKDALILYFKSIFSHLTFYHILIQ